MVGKVESKPEDPSVENIEATPKWLSLGALLAAIGASLCCVVPFVLVLLGLGGSWLSTLVGLSPYRPIFIGLTLGLLGWAYYKLYRQPCDAGRACAQVRRRQRIIFWVVAGLTLALIAFPWYAPWFLE